MVRVCKDICRKKITYKQALKDASPTYKTRKEKKTEEPKEEAT